MRMFPNDNGQGIIEYLLIIILAIIVLWIIYRLLGPAITEWIQQFLNNL
jgi:hypothetical protein